MDKMNEEEFARAVLQVVKENEFTEDAQFLIEEIGKEKFIELTLKGGGLGYHVPMYSSYQRAFREILTQQLKTKSLKQIARQIKKSPGFLRKLIGKQELKKLNQERYEKEQEKLF